METSGFYDTERFGESCVLEWKINTSRALHFLNQTWSGTFHVLQWSFLFRGVPERVIVSMFWEIPFSRT